MEYSASYKHIDVTTYLTVKINQTNKDVHVSLAVLELHCTRL